MSDSAVDSDLKESGRRPGRRFEKLGSLVFCAGGILVCYFYFGVLQESM